MNNLNSNAAFFFQYVSCLYEKVEFFPEKLVVWKGF